MPEQNLPGDMPLWRRWRNELILALVVIVVAGTIVLVGSLGNRPEETAAQPATTTSSPTPTPTNPSPTMSATTEATQSPPVGALPDSAMLTGADLHAPFIGVTVPFHGSYSPNPFTTCAGDGIPGGQRPIAMRAIAFDNATSLSLVGGEWAARFAPGGAQQTVAAIAAVLSGPCAGKYDVQAGTVGGDESILAYSADAPTVIPQSAHGIAIYYAVVRKGDYLVWVTIIDQSKSTGEAGLATSLAQRAQQRLCDAMAC